MKIRVTFKDPDSLLDDIQAAVRRDVGKLPLCDDERQAVAKVREEQARVVARTWFDYGEYLTVEIDTETQTCRVLTVAEADEDNA